MRKQCFLALALVVATAASTWAQPRTRVAVIEFTEKAGGHWSGYVGKAAEDWFVNALVNAQKFQVMERQQLQSLMQEQGFQLSGAVDPSTAARLGKMAGVQYVVFGNIDFAQKNQEVHTGGLGSLLGKAIPWGSAGKKTSEGNLTGRVVSVETGEIVFSQSETVSASNFKINVMGTGAGTDWDETVARKTFQPAVDKIVEAMVGKLDTLQERLGASATGVEGKIVMVRDGKPLINLGKLDGASAGGKYAVVRAEVIKDPESGQELGRLEQPVGSITILQVAGDHLAICKVDSGDGFRPGDVVKAK